MGILMMGCYLVPGFAVTIPGGCILWQVGSVGVSVSSRLKYGYVHTCVQLMWLDTVSRSCCLVFQACAAYSFITIPSLESVYTQLLLYLASGQVALLNQCCSQGIDLLLVSMPPCSGRLPVV